MARMNERINPDLGLAEKVVLIKSIASQLDELHSKRAYDVLDGLLEAMGSGIDVARTCIADLKK
jgi:hypothetical protein